MTSNRTVLAFALTAGVGLMGLSLGGCNSTAKALGMTKVVPDAEIGKAAHELATSLAQGPTVTLGYIKRNINNAEHLSLEACFDAEAIHHSRASETADHKEAAKAFVEKRKAVFQGQ